MVPTALKKIEGWRRFAMSSCKPRHAGAAHQHVTTAAASCQRSARVRPPPLHAMRPDAVLVAQRRKPGNKGSTRRPKVNSRSTAQSVKWAPQRRR